MKLLGIFIVCFAFLMLADIKFSEAQENIEQLNELSQDLLAENNGNEGLILNRQKRGTCSISPGLCFTHCRVKGFGRGLCTKKKVCVCRR